MAELIAGNQPRPFARVMVDHVVRGRTRVWWRLDPDVCIPGTHDFQLEVGNTGNPIADDWTRVGGPVRDAPVLVDDATRLSGGRNPTTHYRVRLIAPGGEYVSRPEPVFGWLPPDQWLLVREVVRRENLRMDAAHVPWGWLLKRKREGVVPDPADPAEAVTDYLTGGITRTTEPRTVGTEYVGGFYAPIPFRVDFDPGALYERRDDSMDRGTVDDDSLANVGRVVTIPPVAHWDAFVQSGSDERFYFHRLQYLVRLGRVPVVARAELRQAPFSDIIYSVAVPAIDPRPGGTYCG